MMNIDVYYNINIIFSINKNIYFHLMFLIISINYVFVWKRITKLFYKSKVNISQEKLRIYGSCKVLLEKFAIFGIKNIVFKSQVEILLKIHLFL